MPVFETSQNQQDSSPYLNEWGLTLRDLYGIALLFFKDQDGKAMHLSYEERLHLIGLSLQVANGKFDPSTASPLGVFDVIGRDRRLAWQQIGEKNKSDAMFEFITILSKTSSIFKPFVEAHKRDAEEKIKKEQAASIKNLEESDKNISEDELAASKAEELAAIQEDTKRKIQDALNQQTFPQFKAYAEQQYPSNPDQQGILIRQLQEQHYEQYMRQINQQQIPTNIGSIEDENDDEEEEEVLLRPRSKDNIKDVEDGGDAGLTVETNADTSPESETTESNSTVAAASMWTRKDIKEFKENVKAEGGEAIIKVGQGESVTVRVPTHEDGSCLFWEFATDSYDIGFGLFFEWTDSDEPVSVQITEENSTDDDEEDDPELAQIQEDIEKGRELLPKDAKANTDVIIPIYRRDAHLEVYVGSHIFPGKGVYLLKFDNSYSFWRSKTLYYRVYYTK